jgi:hypothetical protein
MGVAPGGRTHTHPSTPSDIEKDLDVPTLLLDAEMAVTTGVIKCAPIAPGATGECSLALALTAERDSSKGPNVQMAIKSDIGID